MSSVKRIGYIDALRGFTIFLVVFSHIELFSLGVSFEKSLLSSFLEKFRMPLFFFISGFVAYKNVIWNGNYYFSMIKKKFLALIIPTLFFWWLYNCLWGGAKISTFFISGPQGYWFTIALFYMFIIYYSVMIICRKSKSDVASKLILICVAIIGAAVYIGGIKYYDLEKYPYLCLTNVSRYFEFFVLGLLMREYQFYFIKWISKDYIKLSLILSFFLLFIITWKNYIIQFSLIQFFNHEFTLRYLGLFVVFSIFYHYRHYFDSDSLPAKFIRFIGRRTLDIYLIHWFFIPSKFNNIAQLFSKLVESAPQNIIFEFAIVFTIAILVIALCLLISSIIRSSSILGHYLLGAKYPES